MKCNGPTAQSLSDIFSVVDIDFPANRGRHQCPMLCRFLGRRDDEVIHALWRPASKKRQGTNLRDVWRGSAAGAMGIFAAGSGLQRLD